MLPPHSRRGVVGGKHDKARSVPAPETAYNMSTLTTPDLPKYLMPRDADAVGPQNEAERRLYELVMEGINSGPSLETTIEELGNELRARIRAKR